MPVSIHSEDEECTPRAFVFPAATKPSQRLPLPEVFFSPAYSRQSCSLPPSLSDPVEIAPDFQPFDGCDLVLRSTKVRPHTDFYVDRRTIYDKSPYLKRKLTELGPVPEGIDVISWEDRADTLESMLCFIYTDRSKPVVRSVEHLRVLLKAARKYEIETARHALGTAVLLDYAKKEPLRAFAIACEFGLADQAVLISKETLEIDIMKSDKYSDLGRVSLSYYHRLIQLHRRRATEAIDILHLISPECPMEEADPPFCRGCGTNATWWQVFVEYGCAELKRRPVSTTIFSPDFLAKCVRTSKQVCEDCVESYMHVRSQKLLTRLKEDIDALPVYIMPTTFPLD
ncbi:The BTB (BR-C, ttk and bab)/POZ (Pox virus and Zinc finger) domain [Ceratobasidium sp. AG-Ba]|nr:The BTB (BR-C, ttk and bab)/POZ (Pox virus and Zinc finger) domain [Ceratobasidium sp. AG-Ba]